MKKRTKRIVFFSLVGIIAAAVAVRFWAGTTCTEYYWNFTENYSDVTYKNASETTTANWPPAPIRLPYLGADFSMQKPDGMGGRIYVCDSGDFDGDGYPDLIGLQLTGTANVADTSRLVLVRNIYPTTLSSSSVFSIDASEVYESFTTYTAPASLCVGDFNGDGKLDFFFMKNSVDSLSTFSNYVAGLYINTGTATNPSFSKYTSSPSLNLSSKFQAAGVYLDWVGNHCVASDIDKDGDVDIIVISGDKIFLARNPGPSNFTVAKWEVSELNYNENTGYNSSLVSAGYTNRGGAAVAAADFDNDGDIDIVGGTVNEANFLVYYENDGTGNFTRKEIAIPDPTCTGTVAILAKDFTGDGLIDIVVATDAWNAGNQAKIWMLKNNGLKETTTTNDDGEIVTVLELDWTFRCQNGCNPVNPSEYDVDFTAALDYDQDGDIDFVEADANHSGDYYLVINQIASVYSLLGQAVSSNVTDGAIDPDLYAITAVRVTNLQQSVLGTASGLTVSLYFSNNNGQNWELYRTFTGSEISSNGNFSSSTPYSFQNFGCALRWKIILTAPEDPMSEYSDASYDTPQVSRLSLTVTYVDRKEYSRSSAAATVVTKDGNRKKLILSASFIFPTWEGHLRAYDVTSMTAASGSYSNLTAVSSSDLNSTTGRTLASGVDILWDAGELLDSRSSTDRTIYTAYRAGKVLANPLQRLAFKTDNVATLGTFLSDVNNNPSGLIEFIRGTNRDWKLGDINHSTPVVVGPPSESADYMGAGYDTFMEDNADRTKVVYIGANDGMLHCFNALTGEELWGFIPYNLLPKLTNMWAYNSSTGTRYFSHDIYVDGTPTVADVKINGVWKTVLVCGQGAGKGSTNSGAGGSINYYFALDVTDPADPKPLWEFTHTYRSGKYTYPSTGETWSVPAFGRVSIGGADTWVFFMGSGFDNSTSQTCGDRFYVVRADTGAAVVSNGFPVTQVNTNGSAIPTSSYRYANIKATIPGSPTALDSDGDGYIEYVYYGDLDGRIYRLDVTNTSTSSWRANIIYTDKYYYPIVTKPAIWQSTTSGTAYPYIFFGTGGNDAAPNNRTYSFVCLRDTGSSVEGMWYVGSDSAAPSSSSSLLGTADCAGTMDTGEKVWADPVLSDYIVYFSTLKGSIEQVNPCLNTDEAGELYARLVTNLAGNTMGRSVLKSSTGSTVESLQLVSKARQAVTVGEAQKTSSVGYKREVYIQEYDSTLERLEQPISSILKIKGWREIYQIFR